MVNRIIACLVALAVVAAGAAEASTLIPRRLVGCVASGVLISEDGRRMNLRRHGSNAPIDLSRYEGRRVRFNGLLSLSDYYFATSGPHRLGRCREGGRPG